MEFVTDFAKGLGTLFYVVNPWETMFENVEDLPHPSWTEKVSFGAEAQGVRVEVRGSRKGETRSTLLLLKWSGQGVKRQWPWMTSSRGGSVGNV